MALTTAMVLGETCRCSSSCVIGLRMVSEIPCVVGPPSMLSSGLDAGFVSMVGRLTFDVMGRVL